MVNSPSNTLGDFEKHTRDIGSNLMRKKGYHGQGIGKEVQWILMPVLVEKMAKHQGLGFNRQEANTSAAQTTFSKELETKKESMCIKPFKSSCRMLEEGIKEMIMPSIITPTYGGPTNQSSKNHHKLKRYDVVCFYYKKMGHKDSDCWHSKRPRIPGMKYFQYYKLNGHWEARCCRLHLELHSMNQIEKKKAWRFKLKGEEELSALASQGEVVLQ